ncbi:MAG: hypothetical protein ACI4WM_02385, partial [Erysipelotrichaceae bacterium]
MKNVGRYLLLCVLLIISGCSSMTSVSKIVKDFSVYENKSPDCLVFTETQGDQTLKVEVKDSKFIKKTLDTILNTKINSKGEYVDMYQYKDIDYCFYYGDDSFTFSFVPDSYFYYDGLYYEVKESSMSKIREYLHQLSVKTDSTLWYSNETDFEYEFIDNGDEARSLIRISLTLYNHTLEGYIEGGYDVLNVDREADKYIIEYTYGDF